MKLKKISIIGTVGIPASYGGFETLVENLARYNNKENINTELTVYCSSKSYDVRVSHFLSANLRYIPLQANGIQSVPYDIISLILAVLRKTDVILLLGVSGAIALPFVRLFSQARIVTNIDGIEWRREKWKGFAKYFLRFSERLAVQFSHVVISDNGAIADYVEEVYGITSKVIAYGGDHALTVDSKPVTEFTNLPEKYAFSVCRIEPENNIHLILESFHYLESTPLILVGNWDNSEYGSKLKQKYMDSKNLYLLDPIYDLGKLKTLRSHCLIYVHGHSAGGTNPSLVEAMHFGVPIIAYDCVFNRSTTENKALYFDDVQSLQNVVQNLDTDLGERVGAEMREIANRRYTWDKVAEQYFTWL